MPTISTINGIAEDNIATHNGITAANVTSRNGDTWAHYVGMVATGGTITTDGSYKVHTFNASASPGFTVTTLGDDAVVQYLVIAGGGGGGGQGGGGAVSYTHLTLPTKA